MIVVATTICQDGVTTSARRVKAEGDETDQGKVAIGQNVIVQADGLGGNKLTGTVTISAAMGRKQAIHLTRSTATF
jgi:hypothetical protein